MTCTLLVIGVSGTSDESRWNLLYTPNWKTEKIIIIVVVVIVVIIRVVHETEHFWISEHNFVKVALSFHSRAQIANAFTCWAIFPVLGKPLRVPLKSLLRKVSVNVRHMYFRKLRCIHIAVKVYMVFQACWVVSERMLPGSPYYLCYFYYIEIP